MKKRFYLITLLVFACLFISCDTSPKTTDSDEDEKRTGPVIATWFEYITNASTNSQTTFFYINTNGEIERAGNSYREYFGTQLEMLKNQFSWSICIENEKNGFDIKFRITEPPVWADEIFDDNSTEDGNDNNPSDDETDGNDIPSEDNESEITLPSGYEWWCFEGAILNYDYFYVLYQNSEAIRCGVETMELDVKYYGLYKNKEQAIQSFAGNYYQIKNMSKLPSWAFN